LARESCYAVDDPIEIYKAASREFACAVVGLERERVTRRDVILLLVHYGRVAAAPAEHPFPCADGLTDGPGNC